MSSTAIRHALPEISLMTAAVFRAYGGSEVVEAAEVPVPKLSRGQVLVRVHASSVNPLDAVLASGELRRRMPLVFPAVLGFDVAGEVVAIGEGVQALVAGDRVYGRIDARTGGAHAEYVAVSANVLDRIPHRLSFQQAAALPLTATTALQGLRMLGVREGEHVVIIGASGGVGVSAVQIATAMGAHVTCMAAPSTTAMLRRLGASRVIDYAGGDVDALAGRVDAILDVAARSPWRTFRPLLERRGRYASTGISVGLAIHATLGHLWSRQRAHFIVSKADGALMRDVSEFVDRRLLEPVVDSVVPLRRIADAYARLAAGGVRGKVVVDVSDAG